MSSKVLSMVQLTSQFEGQPLTTLTYKGRPCWIAAEVGRALGYSANGGRLVDKITAEWSEEMDEVNDFLILRGAELADLKRVLKDPTESVGSFSSRIMLLFEQGLYLVCLKSNKPVGKRLRRFIVDEVLPQVVRDGAYLPDRKVVDGRIVDGPGHDELTQRLADERSIVDLVAYRQRLALDFLLKLRQANVVSEDYFQRHTEQSLAMIKGTEPSGDRRLIDVSTFLKGKGLGDAEVRLQCSRFGKLVKQIFINKYGSAPGKAFRFVNGSDRLINCYTDEHLPLMEEAFEILFCHRPALSPSASVSLAS